MKMAEGHRVQVAKNMTQEEKEFLMNHFSKFNTALDEIYLILWAQMIQNH
jgi:hypothetical protein